MLCCSQLFRDREIYPTAPGAGTSQVPGFDPPRVIAAAENGVRCDRADGAVAVGSRQVASPAHHKGITCPAF